MTPASDALASGTLAELRIAQGQLEDAARLLEGWKTATRSWCAVAALHLERNEPSLSPPPSWRSAAGRRGRAAALISSAGRDPRAGGDRAGHPSDAAAGRARAVVELGDAHDCDLIVAYGRAPARTCPDGDGRGRGPPAPGSEHSSRSPVPRSRTAPPRPGSSLAGRSRQTDQEVAAAEARAALTVFEDLGAGRDADVAAALLRELGVKAARRGPKNIGRLTKREQEVLGLLGEDMSNPEIAERLFISRKTVEHHVARILAKLGVRSRAEAARLAASIGS